MLEAQIEISDELASKGYKRAMSPKAVVQIAAHYGQNLAIIWIVISIADAIFDAEHLIKYHLLFLAGIWIVATAGRYRDWSKEIAEVKGWRFHAALDDAGVTTNTSIDDEQRHRWDSYKNYVEYDTYLQIEDENGGYSFLPKTPELFEMIEFTKTKIREK